MSNYDLELGADTTTGLHGWTGPPRENTRGKSVKSSLVQHWCIS